MTKNEIMELNPASVWKWFYEISQIPRCSTDEERIMEFLKEFSRDHGLEYKQDEIGNICIKKPAAPGFESRPGVVLQGHVDMVCEKNAATEHDFSCDPILLLEKDGWLTADGTTLGADNGIAVAMALAVLESDEIKHGPLEALFTVDEESALTGALNLDPSIIDGSILFNMDSEEEGVFYIGCAGGVTTIGEIETDSTPVPAGHKAYELQVTGFKGGHSGGEIHEGRGNAVSTGARILKVLSDKTDIRIYRINGGGKHNAIPREMFISFTAADQEAIVGTITEFSRILKNEMGGIETKLSVNVAEQEELPKDVFSKTLTDRLLDTLFALPHGVIKMSRKVPGLVETSTNLASIKQNNGILHLEASQRSSVMSEIDEIAGKVESILKLGGFSVHFESRYPSWEPDPDSSLLKLFKEVYKREANRDPEIKAIHAGLECGVIGAKIDNMEMISFGPDMEDVHTPDERIKIDSVESVWEFFKTVLQEV